MKYVEFLQNVNKNHQGIFFHQKMSDVDGNTIPIVKVPKRFVTAMIDRFLKQCPRSTLGEWITYAIYMCVPDVEELMQLYEAEHGHDMLAIWVGDLFKKITIVNPLVSWDALVCYQEPEENDKVVYINFSDKRRRGKRVCRSV